MQKYSYFDFCLVKIKGCAMYKILVIQGRDQQTTN